MPQNTRDQQWLLDAGNDPQLATAIGIDFNIDGEDAFEALHPIYRCNRFIAVHRAPRPVRHNLGPVLEVGCKYPWKRVRLSRGRGTSAG